MPVNRTVQHLVFGGLFLLSIVPAEAATITFDSRTLFESAAPGLPVETFETGLVAFGGVTLCNGPLSSAAASACFPAGALLPDVTYSASPGPSMALLGAGFPPLGMRARCSDPICLPTR